MALPRWPSGMGPGGEMGGVRINHQFVAGMHIKRCLWIQWHVLVLSWVVCTGVVTGSLLCGVCLLVSLGGILSEDWANGSALVGGSEYYSKVKLGLWYGTQLSHSAEASRTLSYGWCARNSGSNGQMGYDESYCFDLQAARIGACVGVNLLTACLVLSALLSTFVVKLRLEATMGRIAAIFAAIAAGFLLMTVSLWARLILGLSASDKDAKLSLGVSWLSAAAGFVLSVLTSINLLFAARRVAEEVDELRAEEERRSAERVMARQAAKAAKHGDSPEGERPRDRRQSGEAQPHKHARRQSKEADVEEGARRPTGY